MERMLTGTFPGGEADGGAHPRWSLGPFPSTAEQHPLPPPHMAHWIQQRPVEDLQFETRGQGLN